VLQFYTDMVGNKGHEVRVMLQAIVDVGHILTYCGLYICLCVDFTDEQKQLNQSRCHLGQNWVDPRNDIFRWSKYGTIWCIWLNALCLVEMWDVATINVGTSLLLLLHVLLLVVFKDVHSSL